MRFWFNKYYLVFFILIFSCKTKPSVDLVPVEVFFKSSQQTSYRISPNGKSLAYLQDYKGKMNVFVRGVNDIATARLTTFNDISVKAISWVGDNKLLCEKEKDSLNSHSAFLINKDGTQFIPIKSKPNTKINVLDNQVQQGKNILVISNDRQESLFDVYQLNIETGAKTLFVKNPGNIISWFANNAGEVNLGIGGDGVNETIYYRESAGDDFKAVISNNFKNTLKPLGFTKNKQYIYALSNLDRDKLALVEFDCKKGKEAKVIYHNPDADILEVLNVGVNSEPALVTYEVDKRQPHVLNKAFGDIYKDILDKLPNREIKMIDKDSAGNNFIIKTYTDKNPGAYFIYNVQQKSLEKLSKVNPQIDPANMCEMQSISYKTKDGLIIHGYLTLPLGKEKKNLPCVVLPHQGPSLRNTWGYTPEVQFLANRGYAVLQMNYRGSTGYGKAFQTAGFKQWGTKMQDDIFDGITWLIDQGIANPTKIGVFGYGFGGYSAINQVIRHPELYKCAASYSGYINLFTYIKGFPAYFKPYKLMLNEIIGNPETDIDYLKSASPVFQIEKITAPILIAQGGKDSKVNVNETNQFVKELRKRGVPVNYILNEKETQLFKDAAHKLTLYKELESFLDRYLKNQ